MRDKLKPPTDYSGNDPIRYYLYDIAISLRLLTAQKGSLPSAPGENSPTYTDKGCTCQACKPTMTFSQHLNQSPNERAYLESLTGKEVKLPIPEYPIGYLGDKAPEDMADDPRVKAAMADHMLKDLIKQLEDTKWPVLIAPDWAPEEEKAKGYTLNDIDPMHGQPKIHTTCQCMACMPPIKEWDEPSLNNELPSYDFGSKYFRTPSGSMKGEWYLHEDGRYHWRPNED